MTAPIDANAAAASASALPQPLHLPDFEPLTAWSEPPQGAVRLNDWGLIRAQGPDTVSFLQGQLTNDLSAMGPGQARLAGYCSPKGRLLASWVIWRESDDSWLLAGSADLLPAALKRLSMFVMRAKCKLSDASGDLAVWGLAGEVALACLGPEPPSAAWRVQSRDGIHTLRLPDVAGLWRGLQIRPQTAPAPELPALAADVWAGLEAASAVARISGPTVEAFVPQMINFELVGGVNFKKGCYPGQEVVARSQYRGTLKRRGALLLAEVPLQVGQEIFHSDDPGQPAGIVVLAGPWAAGAQVGFAELKLAALTTGQLHLGAADGPRLHPRALPYALPTEPA